MIVTLNEKNVRDESRTREVVLKLTFRVGLAQRRERRREKKRIIDPTPSPKGRKKQSKKKPKTVGEPMNEIGNSADKMTKKSSSSRSKIATALLFCNSIRAKNVGEKRLTVCILTYCIQ